MRTLHLQGEWKVALDGDSIWDEDSVEGKELTVVGIVLEADPVEEDDEESDKGGVMVYVAHNGGWAETYTDGGWERGITELVDKLTGTSSGGIFCTEQGGQENGLAEMETGGIWENGTMVGQAGRALWDYIVANGDDVEREDSVGGQKAAAFWAAISRRLGEIDG